jgi:class 3 adenylate cyclase
LPRQFSIFFTIETHLLHFHSLIHSLAHSSQNALSYFKGSLRQFLQEDKVAIFLRFSQRQERLNTFQGVTLIGAFGLPTQAFSDDGIRCLKAAMHIHYELKEKGFRCAIGVTTGKISSLFERLTPVLY